MRIDISDLQNIVKIDKKEIIDYAKAVLKAMKEDKAELSLLFVNDPYIKVLNRKYLGINSRTDVLAFSMREGEGVPEDRAILGDVVISTETASREAKKRKIHVNKEIRLYLVHGILHLLGYDDKDGSGRKKMRKKQAQLLEAM